MGKLGKQASHGREGRFFFIPSVCDPAYSRELLGLMVPSKPWPWICQLHSFLFACFFLFIFNCRIIALQCCIGFCHTAAWISHTCTHVPSLLRLPSISHPIPPFEVVTEHQAELPLLHSNIPLASYFTHVNDVEAETPILWPPDVKAWLIWKDPDAGKDWGQEEKGMTEDEMVWWHHRLNGHEFGWTQGVGDGQGVLACCNSWGCKESDTTERLNWTECIHVNVTLLIWPTLSFPLFVHKSVLCVCVSVLPLYIGSSVPSF